MEPSELEGMLLTRDEVPVHGIRNNMKDSHSEDGLFTFIPIHPAILDLPEEIRYDHEIALSVMNQTLDWYYEDLERYVPNSPFLKERAKHKEKWEDSDPIPIGMAWIVHGKYICDLAARGGDAALVSTDPLELTGRAKFSPEKLREYSPLKPTGLILRYLKEKSENEEDFQQRFLKDSRGHTLMVANGDYLSDHLFLRDWAILYHNKLLGIALGK